MKYLAVNVYVPLLLISYIIGNAAVDIFLTIGACLALIKIKSILRYIIDHNHLIIICFFILFYLSILISASSSDYLNYSFPKALVYIRFLFFSLFLYFIFNNSDFKMENLKKFISVMLIFFFIDSCFQSFMGQSLFGYELILNRASSLFEDELILGSFIFFLFSFYSIIQKEYNYKYFILFVFAFITIILSSERIALIKFIFFHFLLFSHYFFVNKKRIKTNIFKIILFPIILLLLANIFFNYNLLNRHIEFVEKFSPNTKQFILYSGHYTLFNSAYNIFSDNIFFGSGYKTFRFECNNYKNYYDENNIYNFKNLEPDLQNYLPDVMNNNICNTHPHNIYLEVMSELGLFGILSLLIFLVFFIKIIKFYDLRYFTIVYLFPFVSTGSFYHNKNAFIFFFLITVIYFLSLDRNNSKKSF